MTGMGPHCLEDLSALHLSKAPIMDLRGLGSASIDDFANKVHSQVQAQQGESDSLEPE